MRTRSLFLFILLLSCLPVFADQTSGFYPDGSSGYLYGDLGFKTDILGGIAGFGMGLDLEFGFNPGRFIGEGWIISPFIGIAPMFGADYSPEFKTAINSYYQISSDYAALKAKEAASEPMTEEEERELERYDYGNNLFNIMKTGKLYGAFSFYYGIAFRLPLKWMPVLKTYMIYSFANITSSSSGFQEVSTGADTGGSHSIHRWGFGGELVFFRGYTLASYPDAGQFNLCSLSVYCEIFDLYNSDFGDFSNRYPGKAYFRDYVSADYFKAYPYEIKIGMRIGFNLI